MSGPGSAVPAGGGTLLVSFPGAYRAEDAGILVNVWNRRFGLLLLLVMLLLFFLLEKLSRRWERGANTCQRGITRFLGRRFSNVPSRLVLGICTAPILQDKRLEESGPSEGQVGGDWEIMFIGSRVGQHPTPQNSTEPRHSIDACMCKNR